MRDDWIVKIIDPGYRTTRDVFIYRTGPIGKIELLRSDTIETIDEGTAPEPSMRLSPEALQAFADALDKMGITPKQGFVEGKLQATESHLSDMRQLLKLK